MAISSELSDNKKLLTIWVSGRFDFTQIKEFGEAYKSIDPPPNKFVVDLEKTDYLDSSAIGKLLGLRNYAGGDTADIDIINCNKDVKKILEVCKFDILFKIV